MARRRKYQPVIGKRAQDMLAEMRESGALCCMEIHSDYNYVWEVSFSLYDAPKHVLIGPGTAFVRLDDAVKAAYAKWREVKGD